MAVDRAGRGALVLHGLTSTPASVESLTEAFRRAGYAASAPLLPGHGTSVEDLERARWGHWVRAATAAFAELAEACGRVVVAGQSMGGSLACRLAADHRSAVAGVVAINPFIDPPAESFRKALRAMLADGIRRAPGIGGDAADPSVTEVAYDELPLAALLSLSEGLDDLVERLPAITCPVLVVTSRADHVVPTVSSDVLAERVSGPVERVWLERSWHLATLDYERDEVARRAVAFADKLCGD